MAAQRDTTPARADLEEGTGRVTNGDGPFRDHPFGAGAAVPSTVATVSRR
jgi:hypothetical protein